MLGNEQQDAFVSAHRWAVITTLRASGQPSSSVVAYAREGDQLVVSTPAGRLKTRTLGRDPRVTLCIISNAEPFNYVTVEGRASIDRDNLVEPTRAVFANIADAGYQEPENLSRWIRDDQRVIIRIRAERVHGVIR
jgi:PPOX class probable F420-dependent enzyme